MKIIDILNKIADGTLEDGFKFKYKYKNENNYTVFRYNKVNNTIYDENWKVFGMSYVTEKCLTDEVEAIENVKEIEELNLSKDNKYNLRLYHEKQYTRVVSK